MATPEAAALSRAVSAATADDLHDVLRKLPPEESERARSVVTSKANYGGKCLDLDGQDLAGMVAELAEVLGDQVAGGEGGIILCLLLSLIGTLRQLETIMIHGLPDGSSLENGEQALQAFFRAHDHTETGLEQLILSGHEAFGTEAACKRLGRLLAHGKLVSLYLHDTGMRAGGMRHIAGALRGNTSLGTLEVIGCPVGDEGVEHLARVLRGGNSTLQELSLQDIGMTEVGVSHICDAFAEEVEGEIEEEVSKDEASTSASDSPTGLKRLKIARNLGIGSGGAEYIGKLLTCNTCLEELDVSHCSLEDKEGHLATGLKHGRCALKKLDISHNRLGTEGLERLFGSLVAGPPLKVLCASQVGDMPAAEKLAAMLSSNESLQHLDLSLAPYTSTDWVNAILPAVARHRGLQFLNISQCPGIDRDNVWDSLPKLLGSNASSNALNNIYLHGTPLAASGVLKPSLEELNWKAALIALPWTRSNSRRILLYGRRYSGKTTLLDAMMRLANKNELPAGGASSSSQLIMSRPAGGVNVELFKYTYENEPDLQISVWDLAGGRPFHALHDFTVPGRIFADTLIVLTVSVVTSPDEERAGEIKSPQLLEEELVYWLKSVVSDSKQSQAKPSVVVVFTNKDKLPTAQRDSWQQIARDVSTRVAREFHGLASVQPEPIIVDALAEKDVELEKWVAEIGKSSSRELRKQPAICDEVAAALQDISAASPIISGYEFERRCKSVAEEQGSSQALFTDTGLQGRRAVAAVLHNAGKVIFLETLDLMVTNPRWLCIWSAVIADRLGTELKKGLGSLPLNGLISKNSFDESLEIILAIAPGVQPDQLIRVMLFLDLCYERIPGDPEAGYLLPALFEDEDQKAANGKRALKWRDPASAVTFVGRRLQCTDPHRTVLTEVFFPRLQVALLNHVALFDDAYKMEKNLLSISVNGMEIFIEFSGSSGYFVDILVKSSKSHQQTMEFLRNNIIGTIRTFCASQEGCQGVTLAEAIIRPACLYGADGGNPILCTNRRDQSVLVEELREKMKRISNYEHCWEKVQDSAILQDGQDSGTVLLDGPKDVASRLEPNLDQAEARQTFIPVSNSMEAPPGRRDPYRYRDNREELELEARSGNAGWDPGLVQKTTGVVNEDGGKTRTTPVYERKSGMLRAVGITVLTLDKNGVVKSQEKKEINRAAQR